MSVQQMRAWLIAEYPNNSRWAARVSKMPESQVIAIYYRIKSRKAS